VAIFTLLDYFFGNIPFVQEHFVLVIIGIIAVSLVPAVVEGPKARRELRELNEVDPYGDLKRQDCGGIGKIIREEKDKQPSRRTS
jgi:hypothetical protein